MFDIALYLSETAAIARDLSQASIVGVIGHLRDLKYRRGRLFILGNGGSAANASHAANDFRKIAGIEAYAPTDNVAELTAWINDASVVDALTNVLQTSRLSSNDMLLILSVGGGSQTVSTNLVAAMLYARAVRCPVIAIVGRNGGEAAELSDECILVPTMNPNRITPHVEEFQSVICHLLVNALAEEKT